MSEESIQVPEQNYGPGNVLRAKREEYEWSVEAVAEALHLSTHSIKAIEADRYEDLPGATYVIGYWRSYARLLGIDIEETIEVNKRNLNIVTAEAAGLDVNRAYAHKPGGGGKGWILLLIVLGALGYYAWQQQFFGLLDGVIPGGKDVLPGGQQPSSEATEAVESPVAKKQAQVLRPLKNDQAEPAEAGAKDKIIVGSAPAINDNSEQILSAQPEAGLALQTSTNDKPSSGQAAPEPGSQAGLVMTANVSSDDVGSSNESAENLLQAQQTEPSNTVSTQATAGSGSTATTSEASSQEMTVATVGQAVADASTMVLTLSKNSWLDIRDKTNKRLLYETGSAGQKIEVKGTPPFYVYIGTPEAVTIHYQGKVVPYETHKTGLFARFKLGDNLLESL